MRISERAIALALVALGCQSAVGAVEDLVAGKPKDQARPQFDTDRLLFGPHTELVRNRSAILFGHGHGNLIHSHSFYSRSKHQVKFSFININTAEYTTKAHPRAMPRIAKTTETTRSSQPRTTDRQQRLTVPRAAVTPLLPLPSRSASLSPTPRDFTASLPLSSWPRDASPTTSPLSCAALPSTPRSANAALPPTSPWPCKVSHSPSPSPSPVQL